MNQWLTLIISLPTENATVRMRAWRALKTCGAAVVRDGVYLLPGQRSCRAALEDIATDVRAGGGIAHVLQLLEPEHGAFNKLFDRSPLYANLLDKITQTAQALSPETASSTLKPIRKLRKTWVSLSEIDFFPGEARKQAEAALQELELAVAHALSPHEPHPIASRITPLRVDAYQGRTWATRRRPWVDRLACAWLIRRWIDPAARMLWLDTPADCPADALGFDFDGATFTHVDARVTFEVLLASFHLETPALKRLGALVHYLDVGGVPVVEAAGVESVLAGLQGAIPDDDALLAAASGIFDGLFHAFSKEDITP